MSDVTASDRPSGDFERYGLMAALTLVVLCLLLADRVRSVRPGVAAPPADRLVRVQVGGFRSAPATAMHDVPGPGRSTTGRQAARTPDPVPAPRPTAAFPKTCVVGSGETLGDIAQRELGSARRAREIAELNGLKSVDQVRAGQTLKLPPR